MKEIPRNFDTFTVSSSGDMKKLFTKPLGNPPTTGEPSGFFVMESKKCNTCEEVFNISMFGIIQGGWISGKCKKCRSGETLAFQRTLAGLASKMYSTQKQSSERRGHKPPEYSMIELRAFLLSSPIYLNLHAKWVESGYLKDLKPSCDRIDDYKPYTFDNIRVVTWRENSDKYQSDRVAGLNNKQNCAVVCFDLNGAFVAEYHSQKQASRITGIPNSNVALCCKKKHTVAGGFYWRFKRDCVEFDEKNNLPMITGSGGRILTGVPMKEQEIYLAETMK